MILSNKLFIEYNRMKKPIQFYANTETIDYVKETAQARGVSNSKFIEMLVNEHRQNKNSIGTDDTNTHIIQGLPQVQPVVIYVISDQTTINYPKENAQK